MAEAPGLPRLPPDLSAPTMGGLAYKAPVIPLYLIHQEPAIKVMSPVAVMPQVRRGVKAEVVASLVPAMQKQVPGVAMKNLLFRVVVVGPLRDAMTTLQSPVVVGAFLVAAAASLQSVELAGLSLVVGLLQSQRQAAGSLLPIWRMWSLAVVAAVLQTPHVAPAARHLLDVASRPACGDSLPAADGALVAAMAMPRPRVVVVVNLPAALMMSMSQGVVGVPLAPVSVALAVAADW